MQLIDAHYHLHRYGSESASAPHQLSQQRSPPRAYTSFDQRRSGSRAGTAPPVTEPQHSYDRGLGPQDSRGPPQYGESRMHPGAPSFLQDHQHGQPRQPQAGVSYGAALPPFEASGMPPMHPPQLGQRQAEGVGGGFGGTNIPDPMAGAAPPMIHGPPPPGHGQHMHQQLPPPPQQQQMLGLRPTPQQFPGAPPPSHMAPIPPAQQQPPAGQKVEPMSLLNSLLSSGIISLGASNPVNPVVPPMPQLEGPKPPLATGSPGIGSGQTSAPQQNPASPAVEITFSSDSFQVSFVVTVVSRGTFICMV